MDDSVPLLDVVNHLPDDLLRAFRDSVDGDEVDGGGHRALCGRDVAGGFVSSRRSRVSSMIWANGHCFGRRREGCFRLSRPTGPSAPRTRDTSGHVNADIARARLYKHFPLSLSSFDSIHTQLMLPTLRAMTSYARLIRFLPTGANKPLIGEPVDAGLDVGIATYEGKPVEVNVLSGHSVLSPGERTGQTTTVGKLLSPLAAEEVGTIRCIGLNVSAGPRPDTPPARDANQPPQYVDHAKEANLPIPSVPTVFYKPATALADPYPAPTVIPKSFVADNAADYEAEFVVVIGKTAKNVSEANAWDYVAGYTAANDVSSREAQFATSQWSYSKSFDGACPVGPAFVPASQVKDVTQLEIRGELNGKVVQKSKLE